MKKFPLAFLFLALLFSPPIFGYFFPPFPLLSSSRWKGDDGLNVHGKFGRIETRKSDSAFTLTETTAQLHCDFLAKQGDLIEFRDGLSFQPLFQAVLTEWDGEPYVFGSFLVGVCLWRVTIVC